jgi:acyl-CoA hydrolase
MLADHVEKNSLQGKLKYSLFVGASSGAETENRWAALNMIERRSPHQVGKEIAKGINNGNIQFFDKHLSMFPVDLVYVSPCLGWGTNRDGMADEIAIRVSIRRIGLIRSWMWLLWKQPQLQKMEALSRVLLLERRRS